MKKIAIVGNGTAGALAALHFQNYPNGYELDWYFDPKIPTQAVGEGSNAVLPTNLQTCSGFTHSDLDKIDGMPKLGIYKENWGTANDSFYHDFAPPYVGYHFNAKSLQAYLLEKISSQKHVNIIKGHVESSADIDASYVLDCTGKPTDTESLKEAEGIPVNAAYVTQCFWDMPRFYHTLTIARPYGWVFGIPLKNRCSIGYIYNSDITSLDAIKEDVKNVFDKWKLEPSDKTAELKFNNYFRKRNFGERVGYSGNASFFLEPLEATSITTMDKIQRSAWDYLDDPWTHPLQDINYRYDDYIHQVQRMIALHYYSGSKFKNEFWDFAKDKTAKYLERRDIKFNEIATRAIKAVDNKTTMRCEPSDEFGTWPVLSWAVNIEGLGIRDEVADLVDQSNKILRIA